MLLIDYQRFVKQSKLYSITSLPENVQLLYACTEIMGEAGEVTEKVKKIFRDQDGEFSEKDVLLLKKEVGDVLWGLASICDVLGISLQDVLDLNVKKCRERSENGTVSGSGDDREHYGANHKISIAHESPNSIFDEVQKLTDYDYCLVHLLEESPEYLNHFLKAKDKGREIVLDNSIFELGEAFDADRFAYWVEVLRPDWYIIPDSLENCEKTISNYREFIEKYPSLPGKRIGVLQGKSYEELTHCYQSLVLLGVDKIAISFDYSFYNHELHTKLRGWMTGRQSFVRRLSEESFFHPEIPIHLLGCSLPQEFRYYKDMKFIQSIDTSSPVVHGLEKIRYRTYGLDSKVSTKLFTLINSEVDEDQLKYVKFNIESFRRIFI